MPELPEVETVVRFLKSQIVGEKINSIEVFRAKNIVTGDEDFAKNLIDSTFLDVTRKGKYLLFHLDNGKIMLAHLRMEGKFFVYEPGVYKRGKHDILRFHFCSNKDLVYNDVRKFGTLGLYEKGRILTDSPLAKIGPDPFECKPDYLYSQIRQYNTEIKPLLMDQSIISGIGNIYADEICFASRIDPRKEGKDITISESEKVIEEGRRIMADAIELGGSTIKSYHPALGMDGRMQNELLAYHNTGSCPRCGLPMRRIFLSGRSTHFCPYCQKNEDRPITIAVTGPIHTGKSSVIRYLSSLGFALFDSDKVAKSLYFDKNIKNKVESILGKRIMKKGEVNTPLLRKLLSDKTKKKRVTDILYPALKERAKAFISEHSNEKAVLLEIPLYKGSGLEELIDYLIYVDAPLEKRKARLIAEARDADSLIKINSSYPETATKKEASYIIDNDAGLEELYAKIARLSILDKILSI